MSVNPSTQIQEQPQEASKVDNTELNFRKQEQMYQKIVDEERRARLEAERKLQQMVAGSQDDDVSDEPYVDEKRLNKKLTKFGAQTKQETENIVKTAVEDALYEERKKNWLKNNTDFNEVMQHVQKFAEKDPELAETILEMPDGFERQKLVYKNIKALGLHKKEVPQATIQETIDKNRRNPYYQPSGTATPPYGIHSVGSKHYSPIETKNAYDKMQELKKGIRI